MLQAAAATTTTTSWGLKVICYCGRLLETIQRKQHTHYFSFFSYLLLCAPPTKPPPSPTTENQCLSLDSLWCALYIHFFNSLKSFVPLLWFISLRFMCHYVRWSRQNIYFILTIGRQKRGNRIKNERVYEENRREKNTLVSGLRISKEHKIGAWHCFLFSQITFLILWFCFLLTFVTFRENTSV